MKYLYHIVLYQMVIDITYSLISSGMLDVSPDEKVMKHLWFFYNLQRIIISIFVFSDVFNNLAISTYMMLFCTCFQVPLGFFIFTLSEYRLDPMRIVTVCGSMVAIIIVGRYALKIK